MIAALARIVFVSITSFTGLNGLAAPDEVTAQGVDHNLFDQVLKGNVRDERVDYQAIHKHHAATLDKYLDQIAAADFSKMSREEKLTTYINLYNATVIRTVIHRYHARYTVAENSFKVFDEKLVRLRSGKVSLNHLEHKIIRKQFDEPRIHVALVCAAESCPPLLEKAYRADSLDKTLEAKMKAFVNDSSRNTVDVRGRKLKLSQIFNWFAEDFGGKSNVPNYVDKYHEASTSRYSLSFREYSWKLNDTR